MSIKSDYKPDSTWKTRRQVRYHGLLVITLVLIGLFGSLLAYIGRHRSEAGSAPAVAAGKTQAVQPKHATELASQAPVTGKPKYDFYKVLPQRQVEIYRDEITQRASKPEPRVSADTSNKPASTLTNKPPAAPGLTPSTIKTNTSSLAELRLNQAPPASPAKVTSLTSVDVASVHQRRSVPATPSSKTEAYFIQVGSFRNPAEADRRKASIAFLGMDARIEAGTGNDGATLHRVRIGPIKNYEQLQALRQRLQENNIPFIPVKVN